ncbi:protein FAM199X-B-like [Haliotis rufescens]|uniref:protein FAM199X-B-like n=1 Tax=Haliotis rufescens TaxID=6454 RepID=UPI00201EA2C3|nr:protein FAM199X-B-like [Haliotis rufescens]
MIADTAVTMGSPWFSDSPDIGEVPIDNFDLDLDINAFEAEISRIHRQPKPELQQDMYSFLNSVSCDASVASSECSDDLYVDIDGDDALFCDLQASILNILDDGTNSNVLSIDNIDLADTDWGVSSRSHDIDNQSTTSGYSSISSSSQTSSSSQQSCSDSQASSSSRPSCSSKNNSCKTTKSKSSKGCIKNSQCDVDNAPSSPQMGKKRQKPQSTDGKRWSLLSCSEQMSVVEELSQVISSELGMREQLDIIRIINPNAYVSPTDREFVIDLETIDDTKLQKIQDYIKRNVPVSCPSQDLGSECPNSAQKKTTKRQKCQDRRNQQKVIRQRRQKEYRQMMKEKRSGLFVKEEVLALSTHTEPSEEDVDILM